MLRVMLLCVLVQVPYGVVAADELAAAIAVFDSGRYSQALGLLEPLAERGAAPAQFRLGKMYAAGRGVTMDGSEAARWFEAAANQGDAGAEYSLGRLYISGWGVEKDPKQGVGWLWKAGRQGHIKAQLLLGRLLATGDKVPRDLKAARLWYAQAASQGNKRAARQLARLGGALELPIAEPPPAASDGAVAAADSVQTSQAETVQRRLAELRAARPAAITATPVVMVADAPAVTPAEPELEPEPEQATMTAPDAARGAPSVEGRDDVLVLDETSAMADEQPLEFGDEGLVLLENELLMLDDGGMLLLDDEEPLGAGQDSVVVEMVEHEPMTAGETPASEVEPPVAAPAMAVADEGGAVPPDAIASEEMRVEEMRVEELVVEAAAGEAGSGESITDKDVSGDEVTQSAVEADVQPAEPLPIQGAEWVLARNPRHYTLQLMASSRHVDITAFIDEHALRGEVVAVIESRRRGKAWYSLLYGDYASYAAALEVNAGLAPSLARHGPWLRPYRKIQGGVVKP